MAAGSYQPIARLAGAAKALLFLLTISKAPRRSFYFEFSDIILRPDEAEPLLLTFPVFILFKGL
jgi:hypothetical protein